MKPEGGWYGPLAGLLCFMFLVAACLLFVNMLGTAIGPFRFDAMLQEARSLEPRVRLWQPPSARALADPVPLDAWRAVLPEATEHVETAALPSALTAGSDLIVVADARPLSDAEVDALLDYARRGGAVLLAGWVGVSDVEGPPRGGPAMQRLLGVARVEVLRTQALATGWRGPLASGLERARRLALPRPLEVPAIPDVGAELYWSNGQGAPAGPAAAAARVRRVRRGTIVWLAVLPELVSDSGWRTLYANAFAIALGRPVHELLDVPWGRPLDTAELSTWRGIRAGLRSELEPITPQLVRLRITNPGTEAAAGIEVRIYANRPLRAAAVHSVRLFTRDPVLSLGSEHLDLRLPSLPPGESRAYLVDIPS